MRINGLGEIAKTLDKCLDYCPGVSTLTNFIDIIEKTFIDFAYEKGDLNDYTFYISNKSYKRCVVLLVPILGNIVVGLYDLYNRSGNVKLDEKEEGKEGKLKSDREDPLKPKPEKKEEKNVKFDEKEGGEERKLKSDFKRPLKPEPGEEEKKYEKKFKKESMSSLGYGLNLDATLYDVLYSPKQPTESVDIQEAVDLAKEALDVSNIRAQKKIFDMLRTGILGGKNFQESLGLIDVKDESGRRATEKMISQIGDYAEKKNKGISKDLLEDFEREVLGVKEALDFYGNNVSLLEGSISNYVNADNDTVWMLIQEEVDSRIDKGIPISNKEHIQAIHQEVGRKLNQMIVASRLALTSCANELDLSPNFGEFKTELEKILKEIKGNLKKDVSDENLTLEEVKNRAKEDISNGLEKLKKTFLEGDRKLSETERDIMDYMLNMSVGRLWRKAATDTLTYRNVKDVERIDTKKLIDKSLLQAKSSVLKVKIYFPEPIIRYLTQVFDILKSRFPASS